MPIIPVVLAGGGGTRLWPISREHYPKQFLNLVGQESLLQQTLTRLDGLDLGVVDEKADSAALVDKALIICNEEHRFIVAEQARAVGKTARGILLEPEGRNTAPALTVAALLCRANKADPVLLMMPADHVISQQGLFHRAIRRGYELAARGYLITFGVVPKAPETGYGYIRLGDEILSKGGEVTVPATRSLDAFVEKPDAATAQYYLDSGNYLWNSGIFMMKASVWLEAIKKHRPDILAPCEQAYAGVSNDGDFYRLGKEAFASCPSDSVDYAVMEKVTGQGSLKAAVVALDAGWSDVGSWSSLWQISPQDPNGNVISGDVCAIDSKSNLLISKHRYVAALGCEDLVLVETPDAVMVAPKHRTQDVKRIVDWLKAHGREERLTHRRVFRPWGSYEGIDAGDRFQVKRITVNPGERLSLQMHHHRAEHWIVVTGTAKVTRGEEEFLLSENESTYIPLGVKHRLENPGTIPLEVIEVQSGTYLGEDDIVRFQDAYNRT